ncbi:MAG: STAS domain-containing protein [Nitrospira sp.]|nr:STAS domain-containing protein [Nitrospira sp.]
MNLEVDDSKREGLLTIDGELTIQRSAEFRNALISALDKVDILKIHFNNVTGFDLANLQIFLSANRTAMKNNRKLSISGNFADAVKKTVRDAGFTHLIKWKGSNDR